MAEKPVSQLGFLTMLISQAGPPAQKHNAASTQENQGILPNFPCVLERQLLAPPWRRLMDLHYRLLHAIELAGLETVISLRQTVGFLFNRALAITGIGVV